MESYCNVILQFITTMALKERQNSKAKQTQNPKHIVSFVYWFWVGRIVITHKTKASQTRRIRYIYMFKTTQQKLLHLHTCKNSTTFTQTSMKHSSLNNSYKLFIQYPRWIITVVAPVNHKWRLDTIDTSVTVWTNTLYNISY